MRASDLAVRSFTNQQSAADGRNDTVERFPLGFDRDPHVPRKDGVLAATQFLGCAMAKPYSMDLRVRVVEAVDEGATRQEAAGRFGVSVSSAVRYGRRSPRFHGCRARGQRSLPHRNSLRAAGQKTCWCRLNSPLRSALPSSRTARSVRLARCTRGARNLWAGVWAMACYRQWHWERAWDPLLPGAE